MKKFLVGFLGLVLVLAVTVIPARAEFRDASGESVMFGSTFRGGYFSLSYVKQWETGLFSEAKFEYYADSQKWFHFGYSTGKLFNTKSRWLLPYAGVGLGWEINSASESRIPLSILTGLRMGQKKTFLRIESGIRAFFTLHQPDWVFYISVGVGFFK